MRPIKVRYLEGERRVVGGGGGGEANKGVCYLEGERRVVWGCEANKGILPGR